METLVVVQTHVKFLSLEVNLVVDVGLIFFPKFVGLHHHGVVVFLWVSCAYSTRLAVR